MSALDQAFIKAYLQRGETAAETPSDPAQPASPTDSLDEQPKVQPGDASSTDALVEDIMDVPQQSAYAPGLQQPAEPAPEEAPKEVTDAPGDADGDEVVDSAEDTSGLSAADLPVPAFARTKPSQAGSDNDTAAPTLDGLDFSAVVRRLDPEPPAESDAQLGSQAVPPPHHETIRDGRSVSTAAPAETVAAKDALLDGDAKAPTDTATAATGVAHGDSTDGPFRPMLQVDHFLWPTVCQRLGASVAAELDQLTEELNAAVNAGQKVLALSGCRPGEGVTTLLLCAGQRLARQGCRVILVDAHWQDPKLAGQLGLAPECGWEDVLTGQVPLEDVVIETLEDHLAVLPVRRPFTDADEHLAHLEGMARSLETLRESYDLVLVDLGSPQDAKQLDRWPSAAMAGLIDAVVLVHNVRATPQNRLVELHRAVAANNVAQVGIIQNFVRD